MTTVKIALSIPLLICDGSIAKIVNELSRVMRKPVFGVSDQV